MKKAILYAPMIGLFGLLFACGSPTHNNDVESGDTAMRDGMEAVPPVDTIRRDSTDTIGQPMPTPPLN
ncbi:hypothetical protein PQ465_13175 [Sphingobacterium oryzagri]|uniref:Lipoprotein n=1 Tax=Sphingobacterium oryzagri TaxID=3025669 RepID=A0ABY7WG47_9SPHI|nr:hypothetical protein [Sphingobacterium sp. KACC 22765]WDF67255.1 hypothetical protein PQ465_13175 [Sphingobacterium sp. KACC 22765]